MLSLSQTEAHYFLSLKSCQLTFWSPHIKKSLIVIFLRLFQMLMQLLEQGVQVQRRLINQLVVPLACNDFRYVPPPIARKLHTLK